MKDGLVIQCFRRCQALHFSQQGLLAGNLQNPEPSRTQIEIGEPKTLFMLRHCQQKLFDPVVHQGFVAERAGCDHADNFALHRPFAGSGVAHLLGYGHRNTRLNQSSQIAVCGVIGNATHGNGVAVGLTPGGECYIENFCRFFGVLVEHFVEVAHAIKQQIMGVICFYAHELLHHGGVLLVFGVAH